MRHYLLLAIILLSGSAFAQETPIKDPVLRDLIGQAVGNYPRLKELEEQLKVSDVKDELIHANYHPTLSADGSWSYVNPVAKVPFGGNEFQFQPYNNFNTALNLKQMVYDFGKTRVALDRNSTEKKLTQDNLDNSRNAVAYQVAQIYYAILFLNRSVKVQEDQLVSLHENERVIQSKIKNGDAIQYDLLTTQVRTSNTDNRLKDLKGSLEKQYVMLQWLTGKDQHGVVKGEGVQDDLQLLSQSGDWKSVNPEAKIISRRLELYNYDLKSAMVNDRPNIFAQASGGFRNGYVPDINPLKLNGSVGVGVSVPILSASRPKLQQKLTQVNIETTKMSLTTLENNINKDLASIGEDYKTLDQKLVNSKLLVEQAEKAYQLAQTRYKEGLITNVELNIIQNSVEDANLNLLQTQYLMVLDKLESHKVVGTKLY
jgi:outer membrane protein